MRNIFAWNLGLLAAGLLIAEAIFGSWFFGPDLQFMAAPRPVERRFDVSELYGGGVIEFRRDRYGFRGRYGGPAAIDILVVGGSTTNERYIGEGETWVDVLAENFARAGAPLGVANAGVDGHSTVGHLKSFDDWFARVPGLKPRYVLLYAGINDVHVAADAEDDDTDDATRKGSRFVRWLKTNSSLYSLHRTVRGYLRSRRAGLVHGLEGPPPGELSATLDRAPGEIAKEYAPRVAAYRTRLLRLDRKIRDLGATPIFVTQTRGAARLVDGKVRGVSIDAVRAWYVLDLFNRETLAACRDTRSVCVDLAAELEFDNRDFYDHVHTTPTGSRRIGDYLFAKLRSVVAPRRDPASLTHS
jgi:hypothetical protein